LFHALPSSKAGIGFYVLQYKDADGKQKVPPIKPLVLI
jgi:hypothetical protein